MLGLFIRVLMVIAGFITSLIVARDALNFPIIQMVVVVFLFTFLVIGIAFWPQLKNAYKNLVKKRAKH